MLPVGFALNNEVEATGPEDQNAPEKQLQKIEYVEQADGGVAISQKMRI